MNELTAYINAKKQEYDFIAEDLRWFIRHDLPGLLTPINLESWMSLDVLYHAPRVERLYRHLEINGRSYRACIHPIHPVDDPAKCLLHYHEWNSSTIIIDGGYEMGVGYGDPFAPAPKDITVMHVTKGFQYTFATPYWWHYVRPYENISWSIMLMSPPYPKILLPPQDESHDLSLNKIITPGRKLWIMEQTAQKLHNLVL